MVERETKSGRDCPKLQEQSLREKTINLANVYFYSILQLAFCSFDLYL
jgi:hypothetical protein